MKFFRSSFFLLLPLCIVVFVQVCLAHSNAGRDEDLDALVSDYSDTTKPVSDGMGSISRSMSDQFEKVQRFFSIPSEDDTTEAPRLSSIVSRLNASARSAVAYLRHRTSGGKNAAPWILDNLNIQSFDDGQADDAFIPFIARQVEPSPVPSVSASETPSSSTTPSETPSGSFSASPTNSESASVTASSSPSTSVSTSVTATVSVSSTVTATVGTSASATPTITPSTTPSATIGSSTTPTSTVGTSASSTPSNTPSPTPTLSTTPTATLSLGATPSTTNTLTATPSPSETPTISVTPSISRTPRPSISVRASIVPPTPSSSTSTIPLGVSSPPSPPPCRCDNLFVGKYGNKAASGTFGARGNLVRVFAAVRVLNEFEMQTVLLLARPRRFLRIRYKLDFDNTNPSFKDLNGPKKFAFKVNKRVFRFTEFFFLDWYCFPNRYPITMRAKLDIAAPAGRFPVSGNAQVAKKKHKQTATITFRSRVMCERFSAFFNFDDFF